MDDFKEVTIKLEELVLDENKIVTFKALSQCCGIDIFKAKGIMEDFLQKNKTNLSACYVIWGYKYINDEKATCFVLSKENDLKKTKESFSKVLDCQIYSISKSVPKDIGDIYSNEVVLRQQSSKTVPPKVCDSRIKLREPTIKAVICPQEKNNVSFPKSFEASKSTKPNQSSAIAHAFAKTNKTNSTKHDVVQNKVEHSNTETKKSQPKDQKNKSSGTMAAFVKKGVTPNVAKETKNVSEPKTNIEALKKEMWSDSCDESEEELITNKKTKVEPVKPIKKMRRIIMASSDSEDEEIEKLKKIETKKVEEKKLLGNSKYNGNVKDVHGGKNRNSEKNMESNDKFSIKEKKKGTKNRKRKASESDKEDSLPQTNISLEDSDEDIIPPTPLPSNASNGPCLQYQTVTKTFQDDDGFFVTRKEKCLVEVQRPENDREDKIQPSTKVDSVKTVTETEKQKTKTKKLNSPTKKQSRLDFFFRKK